MKTLIVILALLCGALPAQAQFIFGPKSGGGAGGATVTDTVRAVTFDSVRATRLIPIDSIRFNGTTTTLLGGAGNMTVVAGTGNSRTLTLRTTTSAGTAKNTLVLGADSSALFLGELQGTTNLLIGSTTIPDVNLTRDLGSSANRWAVIFGFRFSADSGSFANPSVTSTIDANTGLRWMGTDTLTTVTGGARTLDIAGGAAATLRGGAGSMTIQAGTGNSRTLTLQTTTSAGTAKNTLVLGADSSAIFLGKVIPGDTLRTARPIRATALTAASGTPNTVCIDATTKELTENAATSCVVSAARFKKNIRPLSQSAAWNIVNNLRPSTFEYRDGNRRAIGVIAEQADSVDSRLATRDGRGRINSVNYEQIAVALLAVVKEQQRQIATLSLRVDSLTKKVRP